MNTRDLALILETLINSDISEDDLYAIVKELVRNLE